MYCLLFDLVTIINNNNNNNEYTIHFGRYFAYTFFFYKKRLNSVQPGDS